MHSVISQGRVETIVHSKPRERRLLIEEAAGLGKHRKRRRRAELKLRSARDNLDRALDVEREARARLRPLKRQAQAAELGARIEREELGLRAQLVSEELYKKVTSDVNVSDKQIKDYYDANKSIYVQKQSRDVRHILVTKKALADQLYAQLKSGGNFAQLAKKYSKDPGSAQNGGKLTITRGQTVPQFDKTAFALKTGALSPPIHTQYGYHIIQALSSIRPAKTTPLDKVKASIRQQLEQQKKQDEMTKWVDDLKKKFCGGSRIKYQVGYTPNPDPCAAILSNTGSTSTAGQ